MQLPLCLSSDTSVAHPISSKQLRDYLGHTGALKTPEKQDFGGVSSRFFIFCFIRRNLYLPEQHESAVPPSQACAGAAAQELGHWKCKLVVQTLAFLKGHIHIITVVFSLVLVNSNHLALHSTFPSLAV